MRKIIFLIESSVTSICPDCGAPLNYRDSCPRHMKLEGGENSEYLIRRLKCTHCKKLHRELPDCFVPYKHYAAEVISGVLDGIISIHDADTEDYPCEMTLSRWHRWLTINIDRIEGYLRSVGSQLPSYGEELLKSGISLLQKLRSLNPHWLEISLRFIYNSGGFLVVNPYDE
jgi:hypothetical protein